MAKTKKKRRRKHRGTQGGSISRTTARPRSRAEAKARARSRPKAKSRPSAQEKRNAPPTWRGAINKGLFASILFFVLFVVAFKRPAPASAAISVFMLAFYIPLSYYLDSFFYRRRTRPKPPSAPPPA